MSLIDRYVSSLATGGGDGSEGNPWTTAEAKAAVSPGDRVNIKADGNYTDTGSWAVDGTTTAPIHYRTYGATIGDGVHASFPERQLLYGKHCIWEGFDVTYSGTSGQAIYLLGNHSTLRGCSIALSGATCQKGLIISNGSVAENCVIDVSASTHGNPWVVDLTNGAIVGCKVIGASSSNGHGIVNTAGNFVLAANNSLIGSNNYNGILVSGKAGFIVYGNSFYNFRTHINPTLAASAVAVTQQIIGNVCYNGGYGILTSGAVTAGCAIAYNAIGGMGTARYSGIGDTPTFGDVILTEDPFVDAANGDLTLNNAPGGGALARRAGGRVPALL